MPSPLSAQETLDREFLELRAQLLSLAASLDRIQRGEGDVEGDERLDRLQAAVAILAGSEDHRAERLQLLFSLAYEENWRETFKL